MTEVGGHKVRKVEAELLFIMARKVAPGLGTTGNDGGEEEKRAQP